MNKLIIYFLTAILTSLSFASYAKEKVVWWAETNADRDPVFQSKLVDAFNASAVMMMAPIVILFMFFQRRFIAGLTSGASKG